MSDGEAPLEDDLLQKIIDEPSERYNIELKPWLDPKNPIESAKIAKACLALRNNDGGYLILGFDDDCNPSPIPPMDMRSVYHQDVIQQIVSKYASEPFAVVVEWRSRDGQEHPTIVVPRGVQVPVAAKSSLPSPIEDGKFLIEDHAIYVRSLSANNRVSSSKLRKGDISRLMRLCFDNREADIGNFFRRHLSGLSPEVLRNALVAVRNAVESEISPKDVLDDGFNGFLRALESRSHAPTKSGFFEAAAVLRDVSEAQPLNEQLLHRLQSVRRDLSGWSPWTYIHNPQADDMNPYVVQGQWEALMDDRDGTFINPLLDFWQIDPCGKLYYLRAFEDDLSAPRHGVTANSLLDFYLATYRTTEVVLGVVQMSQILTTAEECSIDMAFRWRGLAGRVLNSWSQPGRRLRRNVRAHDDIVTTELTVTRDMPESAIPSAVYKAVHPLFLAFEGYDLPQEVIENIAKLALGKSP